MIPKNTTNQEQIAEQNAKQFRHEVEQVEDYIFSKKWETKSYDDTPMPGHIWAGCVKEFKGGENSFLLTEEHWEAIVADIKDAGYYVYRKWYHNCYDGYTQVQDHCIVKAPLTSAQRVKLHLEKEWSIPSCAGREQHRGEML